MALTEQEQKDLDVLRDHNFGFKFARQLNEMSVNQHEKLEQYQTDKADLTSELGTARFKEEVKKIRGQIETTKYEDADGNQLVDENGEPAPAMIPIEEQVSLSDSELETIANEELTKMVTRLDDKIAFSTEEIRLLAVEQDFRARGIVIREPIGTTYYQSFDGNDSSDGISKANAFKYLNWFTQATRSPGDIVVCRRPRGGHNPKDISYEVKVGTDAIIGGSGQSSMDTITANHSNATSNTAIKTPGYTVGFEYEENVSKGNTTWNHDNNFMRPEMSRNTDPRDRSWAGYFFNRYYSMAESYTDRIEPTSDGSAEDPIIVMADYDNHWGDFIECAVGKNGDDALNGSTASRGGGYVVEYGSKIIRRTHEGTSGGQKIPVHSYITPGDWIFIGELTGSGDYPKPNIAPGVGDDPYEYAYMVRDVNYDKIVLWHPYKGEMAGEYRKVVSMGYAPRWRSMGYSAHVDDTHNSGNDTYGLDFSSIVHWVFQGISFYQGIWQHTSGNHTERRRMMYFRGDNNVSFKDCQFVGMQRHDDSYGAYNRTNWLWYVTGSSNYLKADKCLFLNSKVGIYEYYSANQASNTRPNYFDIKDCIFNGWYWDRTMGAICNYDGGYIEANYNGTNNQYDKPMCRVPMAGIVQESGSSKWNIIDSEFVNHGHCHIWTNSNSGMKIRNPIFLGAGMDFVDPTVNTIYEAHENLGVRWARPAFAGKVSAYSNVATASSNPEKGMNSVLNVGTNQLPGASSAVTTSITDIVGADHDCKRIVPSTGLWDTPTNYGRKFYDYMNYNIPDGDYGGYQAVNDHDNDVRSYFDDYVGEEDGNTADSGGSSTGLGTRTTFRKIGSAGNTDGGLSKYSNWYTGYRRNDNFNRYDNSTHRNRFTNYFGATALYGAKNVTFTGTTAGRLHIEDGTEKWNSWWCSDPSNPWGSATPKPYDANVDATVKYETSTSAGNKCPKGQPQGEELFMQYHWWPSRTTNGSWVDADTDYGSHNEFNNGTNNDTAYHYRFGNSRAYSHVPYSNISVHATNEWGTETGNGPGQGIGFSPYYGAVMSYYPNYYAYNSTWNWAGIKSDHDTLAIQDYFHLYMNYDKDNLGRSGDLYPEVFHPMIKGSRKGDSAGISKNIIMNYGNKTHPWANEDNSNSTYNDYYTRAVAKPRVPMMETMGQAYDDNGDLGTILRSGGGSYVIKVYPTARGYGGMSEPVTENNLASSGDSKQYGRWLDNQGMMIFEYPFYLSTNARTYTVYLNRGIRSANQFSWGADPTSDECFLEMEYFASKTTGDRYMTHGVRRKDRSSANLTFQSGSGGWEALAVTVTPETEGVGYLRLWWKKPKEANKSNTFYVDPKVEVT